MLGEVGWPLFDMARHGEELGLDEVELIIDEPGRPREVWQATVRSKTMPMPECGSPVELATKTELQHMVEALRRL